MHRPDDVPVTLQAAERLGEDALRFAYEEPASHGPALQRVEGLVLVAPPLDPEAPAKLIPVIDRAKATGVGHVVFISAFGVDAVEQAPLRKIERHLIASGVKYTILRPNFFTDNFTTGFLASSVKQGAIYLAAEEAMFKGMRDRGMPDSAVQYVGALYSAVRAGYASAMTNDFETVTGRKPKTFEAFVREHAANLA